MNDRAFETPTRCFLRVCRGVALPSFFPVPDARLSDDPMANPLISLTVTSHQIHCGCFPLLSAALQRGENQLTAVDGYVSNSWLKSSFWNGLAAIIYGIRSSPGCVAIKTLRPSENNSRSLTS
jgi:hypothetical protein